MFYLKEVELNNFRCHGNIKFELSPDINIIVGNNAVGKTSILESIYFLGVCKSFKTNEDINLIKNGEKHFYIKGFLVDDTKEYKIVSSFIADKGKKISINDKTIKSLSEYYGFLNVVCFSPSDLKLINGEPRIKRRFLDINIGQTDKIYLKNVSDYNKVLKERNELLKNLNDYSDGDALLQVYTDKMASIGKEIIIRREKFLKDIEPYINMVMGEISSNKESINIVYKSCVNQENIQVEMQKAINVDKISKTSTLGPHRDDIEININGLDSSVYGSQGQQRTVALAIKLGLSRFIKKESNKMIVLLDDVFGELDNKRQIELLKAVDQGTQVLITTTSIDNIENEIIKRSKVIKLEEKGDLNG